jgi:hypothetical protein
MLVANVFDYEVFTHEYLFADLALVLLTWNDFFAFVFEVVFHVSVDKLFLRVGQLARTIL